ncbi:Zn(2)-C6 fungal-type domain-containing protein [Fusarium falciforme]|uniref:Zn(2)-C6 fungal-type domain-containing protein n=1 Tax=Fusarium falciforme TaxID=195108 RepID=UPI00230137CC|nr:Zn(2)-C6 fungal-type domain-containing protein [Fusarium falciforme]WAO95906.1 Zn(2)-C6 fungal-type domain-containing protein [Fusarium falciforme]
MPSTPQEMGGGSTVTPGLRAGYVSQLEQRIIDLEQEFQAFKSHVNQQLATVSTPQQPQSPESHTTADPGPADPPSEAIALGNPFSRPSLETYRNYCRIWFDRYHSWFPILHQPTILGLCKDDSSRPRSPASLILDAIAVVIVSSQQAPVDTGLDRDQFCRYLTDEIILAAIHDMSFRKLQALLILTMAEYGSGRMIDFWNLISLCKRISTQLGLRDLVAHSAMNFGFPSVLPPRMLQIPTTAVEREEKIRAFWAIDALDSASTLGVAWHLTVSRPEPAANLPCDEEIWRFPESVIDMYQFGSSEAPSSFSLYVRLVTNELWHVHNFLQQSCEPFSIISLSQRQEECDSVYQRLKSWQNDFEQLLTVHTPLYTDLLTHSGTPTQQPNSILIHCTIHSAIISLHQRLIFPVSLTDEDATHWEAAAERCLSSCDQMAEVIRGANDDTLGIINPHVIYCVFIAARFYLIYSKAMDLPLPNKLYLFIYALRVCGQIWHLAKLLHTVLEVASAEHAGSQVSHPLPVEFFDLQYFSLDIHAALRIWAGEKQGSLLREDHAVTSCTREDERA